MTRHADIQAKGRAHLLAPRRRWFPWAKYDLCAAIAGNVITRDEAKATHGISDAELDDWIRLSSSGGYFALRGTGTKLKSAGITETV